MSEQNNQPATVVKFDLSDLPEEAVQYAFDQYFDRAVEFTAPDELVEQVMFERVETDYRSLSVALEVSPVASVIHSLVEEKLADMEWEINHGERDDYTTGQIAHFRDVASEVLGAGARGVSSPASENTSTVYVVIEDYVDRVRSDVRAVFGSEELAEQYVADRVGEFAISKHRVHESSIEPE